MKGLFAFLTRERGCGGFDQLRDTTSRFCGPELPELGSPVIALSLFLQPKHGAFNGLKTFSSSTQDHSTWLALPSSPFVIYPSSPPPGSFIGSILAS